MMFLFPRALFGMLLTALVAFGPLPAYAQWSVLESDPRPRNPSHLYQVFSQAGWDAYPRASREGLRWFRNARYGLFIHYGLSCFRAADLSWSRQTHVFPDPGQGTIPDEEYDGFAKQWRMENFDAGQWVEMAQRAGFKYIVVIAKHHDGFHMWDTKYSDHKITNTPFGRDYLKELAAACHRAGMPIGVYYSQRDWHHPDYQPIDRAAAEPAERPPHWKLTKGVAARRAGPRHANYIQYMHETVRELMSNYGRMAVLWWDAVWWGGMYEADMWDSAQIEKEVRRLQPHIVINNRASLPGDFDTPEQRIGMFQNQRPWESCISLGPHWAWSPGELKSQAEIVRLLVSTAAGDGNLLLSTGARPDGTFDPQQIERLYEVGSWLERFGKTIYGTRGGPWKPAEWGGATYRHGVVYLHVTHWPGKELELPAFGQEISAARLLTAGGEVTWSQDDGSVRVSVEESLRDPLDTIVEFTFNNWVDPAIGMPDRPRDAAK